MLRMKLLPFLRLPGHMGRMMEERFLEGQNSSQLYLDSLLSKGTGVLRAWQVWHIEG